MNPYKIMLVDDEEEVRTSIIRKIDWQDAGFEVIGDPDAIYGRVGDGGEYTAEISVHQDRDFFWF